MMHWQSFVTEAGIQPFVNPPFSIQSIQTPSQCCQVKRNLKCINQLLVLAFFFFGSAALSSSSLPPPSAISASVPLPLLSCAESYSSATSDSESDWKSSSALSESSSAEPRSAFAATTSSSEEPMSASFRAAWRMAL